MPTENRSSNTEMVSRPFEREERYIVIKVFKVDGCTVYRFHDGGRARYFTNCAGSTQWEEGCGKNCSQQSGVTGSNHQAGNQRQLSPHETQPEPTPATAPGRGIDERYQL